MPSTWREPIEPGIRRQHRASCPSARTRRGGRCDCPYVVNVPGDRPGQTSTATVRGTLADARAEHALRRAAGRPAPRVAPGTLNEVAQSYFHTERLRLAASTVEAYAEAYRRWIAPMIGGTEISDVTAPVLDDLVTDLALAGLSRTRLEEVRKVLRGVAKHAIARGELATNPAATLRLPPIVADADEEVRRVLSLGQLRVLLAGTERLRIRTMLRAAGEAGLRRGEVIGLRWTDVDTAGRRLQVRRAVWQPTSRSGPKVVKTTKGRRARAVAITTEFAAELEAWRTEAVLAGAAFEGYVWPARGTTEPMGRGTPNQALRRVCERVGLVDDQGRALVTFHGMRHTAASLMLAAGVPLIVVSRQLGHADPRITAQVYAHLIEDAQLDAAAAAFSDPDPGRSPDRSRDAHA